MKERGKVIAAPPYLLFAHFIVVVVVLCAVTGHAAEIYAWNGAL